ncbi:acyl-CoA dehydrogenase family protein [Actinophytocola sediminis]
MMLRNSLIAGRLTAEHRDMASRAASYFTPAWLEKWRIRPDGHIHRHAWRDIAAHGFMGVSQPREHGGHGLGLLGALVLAEAVAQTGDGGIALGMHVQNEIACQWLVSSRNPALRERFLPRLLNGEVVACQCDTDPSPRERATATSDGTDVLVTGTKNFVVNGANADLCFVSVELDGQPAIVLIEKPSPGVRVTHVYDKLGTRGIDSATVEFDRVRVPGDHVLSRRGLSQLMSWNRVMAQMRFLIAVDAFLLHRMLLAHVVEYTTGRELGGRPLVAWPVNQHALARARADQELMEAGIVDGYLRLTEGGSTVPEIAQLKWFCVERATQLATLGTDLEGGHGYMWDSVSLRAHAQIRGLRMSGGSQTTMLTIANHSLAARAELAVDGGSHDV